MHRRIIEIWHRIDAPLGALLVLGSTFGAGMGLQSLLDSNERAGLYASIERVRADTEKACRDQLVGYTDPNGPTQRLIAQLSGRVDEQARSLAKVGTSCEKAAASSDKAARAKTTVIVPKAAVDRAASAAIAESLDVNRSVINNTILNHRAARK